jgi:hypothetical protein
MGGFKHMPRLVRRNSGHRASGDEKNALPNDKEQRTHTGFRVHQTVWYI